MIDVADLTKRYGAKRAVDGLSFTVRPGRVTAFVGPNGAGKSTTLRLILGLAAPDAGHALIGGRPYRTLERPLREVGALLDAAGVHPGLRARDHLRWQARANGLPDSRVNEVLALVGLERAARGRVGGFSLGMRQRLGIAGALLGDPAVLMFDEPINGLDPEGIRWLRGLLRSLAAEGRTVLVCSHLMSELQDTADHLIVIGRGRLIADEPLAGLLARAGARQVTVRTPDADALTAVLVREGATVASDGDALAVSGLAAERIAELAAAHGLRIRELAPRRPSLEEIFLALTEQAVELR